MEFIGYRNVEFIDIVDQDITFFDIGINENFTLPISQVKGVIPPPESNKIALLEGDDNNYYLVYQTD